MRSNKHRAQAQIRTHLHRTAVNTACNERRAGYGARLITICVGMLALFVSQIHSIASAGTLTKEGIFEWTLESKKVYQDPFNDVNVDVIFSRNGQSWRVPTFWAGGQRWTVRFAPPASGEYSYRAESTDRTNPDLNGQQARVVLSKYAGNNLLLRHGTLRVSASKRYLEHADGTPFFWLGDTWWTGLSDRLRWEGFQKLASDRKAKGYTVIQIVAGLVPTEEVAPSDPGFCNEGGCVWNPSFTQINPGYFDFADRRILHLVDNGFVPAIVGSWVQLMSQLGASRMKQHWRYIIARYGAYPVVWIAGGEVRERPGTTDWTDVTRFIRENDPYHHPLTVHEGPPPYDTAILDESLTDFDLIQPSHFGWASIATEVAQLNKHYSRTHVTKPIIVGEIGYENFAGTHMADFQRAAFWVAMLNGAAGFTYGTISTAEAYTSDKPFHRIRWGLHAWDEAMHYPGSYQVGFGAQLLKELPWWQFSPHPNWVTPRGTTLLEPHSKTNGFDIDLENAFFSSSPIAEQELPLGEWRNLKGNFRLPYAEGIEHGTRVFYLPYFSFSYAGAGKRTPLPTIVGLEPRQRYRAYYFDPSTGTRFDLGAVERPEPGALLLKDRSVEGSNSALKNQDDGAAVASGVWKRDLVATVKVRSDSEISLVLRYQDGKNHIRANYSAKDSAIYIVDRSDGVDGEPLGWTQTPALDRNITVSAEVRGGTAAISVSDGKRNYTSPIVDINHPAAGSAGVLRHGTNSRMQYESFELRESPHVITDDHLERKLEDAQGRYRGDWRGPGRPDWNYESMDEYAKEKHILLDAYRPSRLPFPQDWVLVLSPAEGSSDMGRYVSP